MTELMSSMGLSFWPSVALVLFIAAFVFVTIRVFSKSAKSELDQASRIPLTDEVVTPFSFTSTSKHGPAGIPTGAKEPAAAEKNP